MTTRTLDSHRADALDDLRRALRARTPPASGGGFVLTDGAWGTEMQARGLAPGEFPDLWNLTHTSRVAQVARSYVDAGSNVILTNTFGANRVRLAEAGLGNDARAINRAGVEVSKRAADGRALVFASMGPGGKLLFTGDVSREELDAAFREQARALADAGADALVVETMSDLDEAVIAIAAARATGLPVVASMVFDAGPNLDHTMMGASPEDVAQALTEAGADVVGANCGQGVAGFVGLCRRLRSATDRPIWIKANAGLPEFENGKAVYRTTPEAFASFVPALREAGASYIGGCCGTTPAFVAALRRAQSSS
ncbi:MAG: homocysteine S-methyltransferase family protein [Burkholderiales bacterium]|nr:homocysteine S-methyltransferase family protein [Burkholderiales bacterium]